MNPNELQQTAKYIRYLSQRINSAQRMKEYANNNNLNVSRKDK